MSGGLQQQRADAGKRIREFLAAIERGDESVMLDPDDLSTMFLEVMALRTAIGDFTSAWDQAGTISDIAGRLNFSEIEPIAGLYAMRGEHATAADVMEAWAEGEEDYDPTDDEEWGNQTAIINEYRELAALQRAAEG